MNDVMLTQPLIAAGARAPLLEVRDLSVDRGSHRAVDRVSFDVAPGEMVAVLGRSGAGKTSLLHALAGLLAPATGRVHWTDQCRDACCAHRSPSRPAERRAVMFQHYRLVPQLSALTNVLCGQLREHRWWETLWGFPAAERQRAVDWLSRLGLDTRRHQAARRLSGGEQQRVAVARALIQQPTLLLADEPVASLDAETAHDVMGLLQALNRQQGLTVFCVLHDLDIAERYTQRVLLLDEGRLVYDGSSRNLQRVLREKLQWTSLL